MSLGSTVVSLRQWSARRMAWVGGIFIAAIVALSAYEIVDSYQSAVRNTGRELDAQARLIAEQTARTVQAVDLVLRHLAQQHRQGAFHGMGARDLHNYLREQAVGLVQVEGVGILYPNGTPRAVSLMHPLPDPTVNVSNFKSFQALKAGHRGLYIEDATPTTVDGRWTIPLGRRIETPSGEFAGVAAARGRIEYFEQFYRNMQLDPATTITLMHQGGTLVARHPPAQSALGKRVPLFDTAMAVNTGPFRSASPIDGVDRFAAIKLVPDYPLAVVVARDARAALAPWRAQSIGTALRTLALSALAAGLLLLLLRQVSRLQTTQERYALAVAGSDDGVWEYDLVNQRVFASARAREISGLPPGPEVQSIDEWNAQLKIHPEDAPRRRAAQEAHLAGKTPAYEGEWRMLHPDGQYRWIRIHGLCMRNAQGKPYRMAGSTSDIDARKRAEDALRASEEQYRSIFNAAADALVLRDASARVIDVNPAFLEISGYTREEVVGGERWVFAAPEMAELAREMHRRTIAGESVRFEIQARRKDGRLIDIEMRAEPIHYRGQPHALGMARDITAQKRAEAERARLEGQLLQSKKLEAIGTLAGGIAHDFNNILAAILGYSDLAQKSASARAGTALRRHIDAVVAAGLRAKSLVERILAFSRSGVGERTPVHVQSIVVETLDLLAASLPDHVSLERRLEAGDATVMGDPTQIHQVVMNLCANAVQAMKSRGTLTVVLEVVERDEAIAATSRLAAGRYVRLAVRDTGSGIAAGVLERIFDPFFTTREVGVGTGLGLSLVHGIVTDLGGGIDVESSPGHGTTFTVYLPWSSARAVATSIDAHVPHGAGETILLVDDEEALVHLGEEVIASIGYEPVGFASSAAALEAFRESPERFQAVLSDEAMPDMTGSDLARAIRAIRPDMPVLLMSGYVTPQFAARAREIGVVEVLAKPLVASDIARSLANALNKEAVR
jgi:PAS domain S-box-containing protein